MKAFTPELDPAVLICLGEYATKFADDFPQSKPARWAGVYLQDLLLDGERKSTEPLSRRVTLPDDLPATARNKPSNSSSTRARGTSRRS